MDVIHAGKLIYDAKQRSGNCDLWEVHRYQICGIILKIYLLTLDKDIIDVSQFKMETISLDDLSSVENEIPDCSKEADIIYKIFCQFSTEGLYRFCADLIPNHYIEGDHVFFDIEKGMVETIKRVDVFGNLLKGYEEYYDSK